MTAPIWPGFQTFYDPPSSRPRHPALPCLGLLLGSNGGGGLAPPGRSAPRGSARPGGEGEGGGGAGLPKLPRPRPLSRRNPTAEVGRSRSRPPPRRLTSQPSPYCSPAVPACHPRPQFPLGPRAGGQALSAVAPRGAPRSLPPRRPVATHQGRGLAPGRALRGGRWRPRSQAHPAPPRRQGPARPRPAWLEAGAATRAGLPAGRGARSAPSRHQRDALLPPRPRAGSPPPGVPAVSAGRSLLFLSLTVPICKMGHQRQSAFRRLVAKP